MKKPKLTPLAYLIALYDNNAENVGRMLTEHDYPASGASVRNWHDRGVPVRACMVIEYATQGAVTCEMLRPDINWNMRKATDGAVTREMLRPDIFGEV